jgi:dolichyl-phosphate beta-glucosyltransferase
MIPFVSIIIPIHNEQVRLRESVLKVIQYGERELIYRYEILLVENGSIDQTFDIARELSRTYRPVRAFQIKERSKAQAVCFGMKMAVGEYRYMCDCDLSTPINELTKFLRMMEDGWDIVIASREHRDSDVDTSFKRWMIGRMFQGMVQTIIGLDYRDTQCGFKLFNAHAANDIFSLLQCNSMAFDVEVLYLAQQLGYYCTDMPVTWHNDPDSRVHILRDSWLMLKDLMQIKKLHVMDKPVYYKKKIPI